MTVSVDTLLQFDLRGQRMDVKLNRGGSLRCIKQIYVTGCLSALSRRGVAPVRFRLYTLHLLHCSRVTLHM